jgi:hypothetical protein
MGKNTSVISVIAGLLLLISTVFSHGSGGKKGSGGTVNPDLDFAQIEYVKATEASNGSWRFDVTVRHNDEGWDHYADAWQVVDPKNGKVLGERILAHPHETEQLFPQSKRDHRPKRSHPGSGSGQVQRPRIRRQGSPGRPLPIRGRRLPG